MSLAPAPPRDEDGDGVSLMGLRLARRSRGEILDELFAGLRDGIGGWIVTANLDHLRRFVADPEARALAERATRVVPDGVPLLWAARLQGTPFPDRVAGSDLVWLLAERAAREGRSVYLMGGNPGTADRAAEKLQSRFPGLAIAGTSCPRVSSRPGSAELEPIRRELLERSPDIVYVGLGAPKQERVIDALRHELPGAWWIGVGISLSFIDGEVRRAPPWMQRTGLEWLHRLVQEPGRLARRYLVEDLPFGLRLAAHVLRARLSGRSVSAAWAQGSGRPSQSESSRSDSR